MKEFGPIDRKRLEEFETDGLNCGLQKKHIEKICIWASCRFQTLYRTVSGLDRVYRALALLARIQCPMMSNNEAIALVKLNVR